MVCKKSGLMLIDKNANIVSHDELIAECVRNGKNTANFVIANFDVFTTSSFMLQKGMFLNQSIFYHECYKNRKVANHDYVLKYQFKSRLLIHFFVIALQQKKISTCLSNP